MLRAELQALEFEEERVEYEEVEQATPEGLALAAQWRALKAACDALSPVGRYKVASVSYRKCACQPISTRAGPWRLKCAVLSYTVTEQQSTCHEHSLKSKFLLAVKCNAQSRSLGHESAAHARRGFLPGPPYEPILGPLTRLPVAWLLLQPSRAAARHQQPAAELAVPVQINLTLPDYLVPSEAFDRGMRIEWRPADRFRMYFGRRQFGTRSGAQLCCRQSGACCRRRRLELAHHASSDGTGCTHGDAQWMHQDR